MRTTLSVVAAALATAAALAGHGSDTDHAAPIGADVILVNGRITTMDERGSTAQAIAIDDGKVAAVGSNRSVKRLAGPRTRRVDLRNRRVLPGLIDGHLHGLRGGGYHCYTQTVRLDLITSRREALAAYRAKGAQLPDDQWIFTAIGGWSPRQLDVPGMFTFAELDAAVPDNPVWIARTGLTEAQVNSKALEVLGLRAGSPGVVVDPATGKPTGHLTGEANKAAGAAILEQLGKRTIDEQATCLADFVRTANGRGLTAWVDAEGNAWPWGPADEEFSIGLHGHQPVLDLRREGRLNARIAFYQYPNFGGKPQTLADTRNAMGFIGDDMLRYMGVGEEVFGGPYVDYDDLTRHLAVNRISFKHHATEKEEIDANLAGFEAANRAHPIADLNWSIDHPGGTNDDLPTDEQLARAGALGIGWTTDLVYLRNGAPGPRYRTMMENSAHMCLATDALNWAPWAPFQNLWYVTTGKTLIPGVAGVPASQRLTRTEALRHATVECGWFLDQDGRLGSLEVGNQADLIVLTGDYFTVPDDAVKDLRSLLTIVDGRIVFADGEYRGLDR